MNAQNTSDPIKNDALQAYKTFLTARSFFFWLMIIACLFSQAAFWLVNCGAIDPIINLPQPENKNTTFVFALASDQFSPDATPSPKQLEPEKQNNTSKIQLAQSLNKLLPLILKVCYYILIVFSILYPFTLLFTLNIAIVGRLGAFADSAKALFLALVPMVLIIPWSKHIAPNVASTLFTYDELLQQYIKVSQNPNLFQVILYYWQFVGMSLITFLPLISAHWYSSRAAKTACRQPAPSAKTILSTISDEPDDTIPLA